MVVRGHEYATLRRNIWRNWRYLGRYLGSWKTTVSPCLFELLPCGLVIWLLISTYWFNKNSMLTKQNKPNQKIVCWSQWFYRSVKLSEHLSLELGCTWFPITLPTVSYDYYNSNLFLHLVRLKDEINCLYILKMHTILWRC